MWLPQVAGGSAIPSTRRRGSEGIFLPRGGSNADAVTMASFGVGIPISNHEIPENGSAIAKQPPRVELLNGMITKQGKQPLAEGMYFEVWRGQWNKRGREKGSGERIGGADTERVGVNLAISIPLMRFSVGSSEKASDTRTGRGGA